MGAGPSSSRQGSSRFTGKAKKKTNQIIKQIEETEGISSITKRELVSEAQQNLKKFESRMGDKNKSLGDFVDMDNNFAKKNKKIMGLAAKAKEGTDPKFRARQQIEAKRRLLADRPGQKQLILSRG